MRLAKRKPAPTAPEILFFVARLDAAGDQPLLQNRQRVVGHPVQHQSGGEEQEHHGENHRHEFHHPRLQQFHAFLQRPVQRQEHRHLDQDRQTATQRVDFFPLVNVHHFHGHFLAVIAKLFLQPRQHGLHFTHLGHGTVTDGRRIQEKQLYHESQQNNRHTPVGGQAMEERQQPEQQLGYEKQRTVIDG